jgi:hypothetical protein
MAPWTRRLFEVLDQSSPRPYEWVVGELRGLVPPGRAWRVREWDRARNARRWERVISPAEPDDDKIRTGQRRVIQMTLNGLRRSGRIDIYTDASGVKWVRIGRNRLERSPEERRRIARKGALTRQERGGYKASFTAEARQRSAEATRQRWLAKTPAEREETLARMKRGLTPESWKRGIEKLSPEARSARSIKGWETRRRRKAEDNGQ